MGKQSKRVVALSLALTFALGLWEVFNPSKRSIIVVGAAIWISLCYAFSSWPGKGNLRFGKRLARWCFLVIGAGALVAMYSWQYWPTPKKQEATELRLEPPNAPQIETKILPKGKGRGALTNKPESEPGRTEAKIINAVVEVRIVCSLKNSLHLPNNVMFYTNLDASYLDGPAGKAYLEPDGGIIYKRLEEEENASVTQKYRLPANSDLIGEPLSILRHYDKLRVSFSGASGNDFSSCSFVDVTFRVNGNDIYRASEALPRDKFVLAEKHSPDIVFLFRHLEIP